MQNTIMRTLVSNLDTMAFILKTKGNNDFWYWVVDKSDVKNYKGTESEFVNDESNATLGYSCNGFKTVYDAIADLRGEI